MDIGLAYGMEWIGYIQRVEKEPLFLSIPCQLELDAIILNDKVLPILIPYTLFHAATIIIIQLHVFTITHKIEALQIDVSPPP